MSLWKLQASFFQLKNNDLIVQGKEEIVLKNPPANLINFLRVLKDGISSAKYEKYNQAPSCQKIINQLRERGLLKQESLEYESTFLERSYRFLSFNSKNEEEFNFLSNKKIAILGLGGIGANTAYFLACSGFENFILIDFDNLQISNLNRQFPYDIKQVGKSKADSLEAKLLELNPKITITKVEKRVTGIDSLDGIFSKVSPGLIVSGIDTPPIFSQLWVSEFSHKSEIPVIFASVGNEVLNLGPCLVSKEAKINYINSLKESLEKIEIDTLNPIPQSIPSTNTMATTILTNEIILFFYKFKEMITKNKRVVFNAFNLSTEEVITYE